ncbi:Leucine-rich repeat receptor-like protein kinase family protein, partial [Klebsormidium nitens]
LTGLTMLHISSNDLSGPIIPELGSLTNLWSLDLSSNDLSGLIPLELGRLSSAKLLLLDLYNNNLSGPIPPELARLSGLVGLYLHNNSLSGPIPPELSRMGRLGALDLSFNGLSGPIPPELVNLTRLTTLDLSNNDLSGPIPPEFGRLLRIETLNLTGTDTSCKTLDLSRMINITNLGLPCSPPPSFAHNNLTYVALSVRSNISTRHLDLSSVPDSCKIVNLTGPHPDLESIRFWRACDEGCVVSVAGTGARLSRSTRRKVCLGRISVFLSGDIPVPLYDTSGDFLGVLSNAQGNYALADPDFVDLIDLGRDGRAYTGVGFSRVQAGNLCGNPEAKAVTALVFGAFAVLSVVATITIVVVARWRRRVRGGGLESAVGGRLGFRRVGLYMWGAALGVLPVVDVVTDFLVLSEVWGAWPMWVVLASVCAPFVWASFAVAKAWSSTGNPVGGWKELRVRWLWPLPALANEPPRTTDWWSVRAVVVAILLLPMGLLGVLVQDLLSVAEKFGLHLATGDRILVFERYHESRVMVELLLESLPQAVFQTGLYVIGSSRATRIYIDQRIFVQSIVVSLCSLSVHYCTMLWEAVYEGRSLVRVFLDRFGSAGQPSVVTLTTEPSADAEVEGLSQKLGNLTFLTSLSLSYNELSDPIPPELSRLTNLAVLHLSSNNLSGFIPAGLGRLPKLRSLDLSSNDLFGPIPTELGSLTRLEYLELYDNGLTGLIPPELGRLTTLRSLQLFDNGLSGPIPPELGRLTGLTLLSLGSNNISGRIPPEIGSLSALKWLRLSSNGLFGPIPAEVGSLSNLSSLDLSGNGLSGPIPPELGNMTALTYMLLFSNELSGPIPPELGRLTRLTFLLLSRNGNGLSGPIPAELGLLTGLTDLSLSFNRLSGPIPPELGRLTGLTSLYLN